jgi:glycogen debranching enzyme
LSRWKYRLSSLKSKLPQPILPEHPEWVDLYWLTWRLLIRQIRHGAPQNGFAADYLDATFSENIFQWDTCFIAAFARYGGHVLPVGASLDNFYGKQHEDGFICREIGPDGVDYWPKGSEQAINPPLFAWAEWLCYQVSDDLERLRRVLPHLDRYYRWIAHNHCMPDGLYWTSNMGSGMDNSPRCGWQWVDLSAQQALAARMLVQIACAVGDDALQAHYRTEHDDLAERINSMMWDEQDGFYYDTLHRAHQDCGFARCKTLAGFWPLLASITPPDRAARLVGHLTNPSEFGRLHPFPTLSADHSSYMPTGGYWLGGVWPPTTYMVIKGLAANGFEELARQSAQRHLDQLAQVAAETKTLWEDYCPESSEPGLPARPDFVGWAGLGPVAMLIEDVLGIELNALEQTIRWRPRGEEKHGIYNLRMGRNVVDLRQDGKYQVTAAQPFTLILVEKERERTVRIQAGSCSLDKE